jgi:hypothetical protein
MAVHHMLTSRKIVRFNWQVEDRFGSKESPQPLFYIVLYSLHKLPSRLWRFGTGVADPTCQAIPASFVHTSAGAHFSSRHCGRMSPIMDKRLRRAPDAEWVLMYRLGLSRKRIAELVGAEPATVGYHLVIARGRDPELETAHQKASSTKSSPSRLARMEEIINWVTDEGRFPRGRSEDKVERSMARWLSDRRREEADDTLDPAYRDGLAQVPGWVRNQRKATDEARWHDRLAQLSNFRAEGNDWPRHRHYASDREHALGVWIHAQRQKHRRGELDAVKVKLLNDAVPGWQAGRTRGRPRWR